MKRVKVLQCLCVLAGICIMFPVAYLAMQKLEEMKQSGQQQRAAELQAEITVHERPSGFVIFTTENRRASLIDRLEQYVNEHPEKELVNWDQQSWQYLIAFVRNKKQ